MLRRAVLLLLCLLLVLLLKAGALEREPSPVHEAAAIQPAHAAQPATRGILEGIELGVVHVRMRAPQRRLVGRNVGLCCGMALVLLLVVG